MMYVVIQKVKLFDVYNDIIFKNIIFNKKMLFCNNFKLWKKKMSFKNLNTFRDNDCSLFTVKRITL